MEISVIIPTYKPQSYLWECLNSLVNQTFPKEFFEIILVLNGCNEPYKSNIEKYITTSMRDMNINFVHSEKAGVSNARNIALDRVKGKNIAFIDDDDIVSPNYLEELYAKVHPNTIVLSNSYAFNDGYLHIQLPYSLTTVYEKFKYVKENKISSKVRKYFSGPCMKLIPIAVIQNSRFDTKFKNGEDTLFMFLISKRIKNIVFSKENAIYYRRYRLGSAINTKRSFIKNIKNNGMQILTYFKYYAKNPFQYNLLFFLTRIGGALYSLVTYKY